MDELQLLYQQILEGRSPESVFRLGELLQLDPLNREYFVGLLKKLSRSTSQKMRLFDPSVPAPSGTLTAYPFAIVDDKLRRTVPTRQFGEIRSDPSFRELGQSSWLWMRKMHAGVGSSIERTSYLARRLGVAAEQITLGAKGTDLCIPVPTSDGVREVPLVEGQWLQFYEAVSQNRFAGIVHHDIVGPETKSAIGNLKEKPCLWNPSVCYRDEFAANQKLHCTGETIQQKVPTLNEQGELTTHHTAPAGHGLFGFEALRVCTEELPDTGGAPLIGVLSNGEDLNAFPSPEIVGWMVKEKVPIAMITTDKTQLDLKGGQLAVVEGDSFPFLSIFETAQAKEAGQQTLFEQLGLSIQTHGQSSFFNTNMALFNYPALKPMLEPLTKKGDSFWEAVLPEVIKNKKRKLNQTYTQVEGAMGSVLLNLDKYWRAHFHKPLVHLLNIEKEYRTEFFTPIKTPFDFFLLYHSDRFKIRPQDLKLENLSPGPLPSVSLGGGNWPKQLDTVLSRFENCQVHQMQELVVEGEVDFSHCILKQRVKIENQSDEILKAKSFSENGVLEAIGISVDPAGKTTSTKRPTGPTARTG